MIASSTATTSRTITMMPPPLSLLSLLLELLLRFEPEPEKRRICQKKSDSMTTVPISTASISIRRMS